MAPLFPFLAYIGTVQLHPFLIPLLCNQSVNLIMQTQQTLPPSSSNFGFPGRNSIIQVKRFQDMEDLKTFDPLWTPRCLIAIPHLQHPIPQLVEGNTVIINRIDQPSDYPLDYPSNCHPARILSVKTPAKRMGHSLSCTQPYRALLLEFGPGIGATLYIPFVWPTRPDQILRQLADRTIRTTIPDMDLLHATSSDGHHFIFPKPFLARLISSGKTRSLTLIKFISLPVAVLYWNDNIMISECLVD
jgi:hypothetical protein